MRCVLSGLAWYRSELLTLSDDDGNVVVGEAAEEVCDPKKAKEVTIETPSGDGAEGADAAPTPVTPVTLAVTVTLPRPSTA